jgi:hypothetical protein
MKNSKLDYLLPRGEHVCRTFYGGHLTKSESLDVFSDFTLNNFKKSEKINLLEIGCGDGFVGIQLQQRLISAGYNVDLTLNDENPVPGDFKKYEQPLYELANNSELLGKFNLIVCRSVFHYAQTIQEKTKWYESIKPLLSPNGVFVNQFCSLGTPTEVDYFNQLNASFGRNLSVQSKEDEETLLKEIFTSVSFFEGYKFTQTLTETHKRFCHGGDFNVFQKTVETIAQKISPNLNPQQWDIRLDYFILKN